MKARVTKAWRATAPISRSHDGRDRGAGHDLFVGVEHAFDRHDAGGERFRIILAGVEHRHEPWDVAHRIRPASLTGVMCPPPDRKKHGGERNGAGWKARRDDMAAGRAYLVRLTHRQDAGRI